VFCDQLRLVSHLSRAHLEKDSISKRAFYRTILMHGFHVLVSMLCTDKIRDTQCGFKLFTANTARKLFNNLHLERWAFDIELIYMAQSLGIPMVEVAVNWQEIPGSKLIRSKLDVITTSLEMARDIVCIRLSYLLGVWQIK
jgi:dolichyl-phosphate beta-glucosyltransferase